MNYSKSWLNLGIEFVPIHSEIAGRIFGADEAGDSHGFQYSSKAPEETPESDHNG